MNANADQLLRLRRRGTSTEQHPIHQFKSGGNLVVILDVTGPDGQARRPKVWDVQVK
jgi:hypothetical protein